MIPIWKLKREAIQLKEQLGYLWWKIFRKNKEAATGQRLGKLSKITEGERAPGPNVAALLIYQPKGILPSTYFQLEYFAARGLSTFLISNAPLAAEDKERLKKLSFRIMERPNIGHDFGGYKDGIQHLVDSDLMLENLILLNDSVWLPVHRASDPIKAALENSADLFGISYNDKPSKPEKSHIQSYFFRFGPRVLQGGFFAEYWRNLPIPTNRYAAVKHCETRLTKAFTDQGYTIDTLYRNDAVRAQTLELEADKMAELFQYQTIVKPRHKALWSKILKDIGLGRDWREGAKELLAENPKMVEFLAHHPHVLLGRLQTAVLKKKRFCNFTTQREAINEGQWLDQINPVIADEIRNWDRT